MLKINNVYQGNSLELLKDLDGNSIDSIVTDPPYELGFMGKSWDSTGIAYNVDLWKECLRVLKPGGHLLSFGGTRTYHRMACAIEDAGFEIRDQIQWIYGSGFPKSQNISKAIDKKFGAEREVVGKRVHPTLKSIPKVKSKAYHIDTLDSDKTMESWDITAPATELAKQYDGWGTALKPANEPIVMARKPLSEKTIVSNVTEWGTGGINIDESRVSYEEGGSLASNPSLRSHINGGNGGNIIAHETERRIVTPNDTGRFPTNVILDDLAGELLDTVAAETIENKKYNSNVSRFFYCPKASKKERGTGNIHPTVKPIKLMEYLVRLVTPENGTVLDPFAGSGTTLKACINMNKNYIGFEMNEEYIEIINQRIKANI